MLFTVGCRADAGGRPQRYRTVRTAGCDQAAAAAFRYGGPELL